MQNKSKILMIGPDINSQGGIASVIKLYKNYGLNVNILSTYSGGSIFAKAFAYCFFIIKYIFILIFNNNIKIVHIHTASRGSFLRKAVSFKIAKIFNKKVVFNIHPIWFATFYETSNGYIKELIVDTLNNSDLILVLSETIKLKIANISQNPNIKILYNPVVIKEFEPRKSEIVNILFLGKLCKAKGVYDIIEATKLVRASNFVVNLYGDGDVAEFEKLITDSNLQDKVKIKGWVSGNEKDEILKKSDVFLLPSYSEGLPMSILEAMAVGLPIISTPVGGISEAVEEGLNGFLIQAGDCKALAEKIDLLASNKGHREQMGERGHSLAKEKFDIKIIIKQLQEIYDEILR